MIKADIDDEIIKFIESSGNKQLCKEVLEFVKEECIKKNIIIDGYRWKSLVSHISVMIRRSVNKEKIDIDESLFSEISFEALDISKKVVDKIANLNESEKFLLSVHFEAAKQNQLS